MTTVVPVAASTAYTAARCTSRASSTPEMTRTLRPVRSTTWARNSPPFCASRTALVAAASTSSTCLESASWRNRWSVSRAAAWAPSASRPTLEASGAQAHHFLLPVHDLEGQVAASPERRSCGSSWCRCRSPRFSWGGSTSSPDRPGASPRPAGRLRYNNRVSLRLADDRYGDRFPTPPRAQPAAAIAPPRPVRRHRPGR